jgi:hypothetical protein
MRMRGGPWADGNDDTRRASLSSSWFPSLRLPQTNPLSQKDEVRVVKMVLSDKSAGIKCVCGAQ